MADTPDEIVDSGLNEFDSSLLGSEHGSTALDLVNQKGVELPYLPLMKMFRLTSMLLSRVYLVWGKYRTGKTAFTTGIAKIFLNAGGSVLYFDAENKPSPTLIPSILDNDADLMSKFHYMPCSLTDDWVNRTISICKSLRTKYTSLGDELKRAATRKRGRPVEEVQAEIDSLGPYLLIVDSLQGLISKETFNKIDKEESISKSYAYEPRQNKTLLRYLSGQMYGLPIVVLIVNHENEAMQAANPTGLHFRAGGGSKKIKYGGVAQDYHTSTQFSLQRIGKGDGVKVHHIDLKVSLTKSGTGPDNQSIELRFVWTYHPETREQYSWYDWYRSTSLMLKNEAPTSLVRDVADVRVSGGSDGKLKCMQISKSEGFTPTELGRMLHVDDAARSGIIEAYSMKRPQLVGVPAVYGSPLSSFECEDGD